MVKVIYEGREYDGEDASFTLVKEDWNVYQLHDGSEFRIRLIVSEIIRIPGEYDQQGNPVYVAKSGNVAVVKAPDNLKRPPTA